MDTISPWRFQLSSFWKSSCNGTQSTRFIGCAGHDGRSIVGVQVALGPVDEARFIYHEATEVTGLETEQAASLISMP